MILWLTDLLGDIEALITAAITVAAAVYVAAVWWRTKALVPTLTAIVVAGIVVWASGNIDVISGRIEQDATFGGAAPPAAPQPFTTT